MRDLRRFRFPFWPGFAVSAFVACVVGLSGCQKKEGSESKPGQDQAGSGEEKKSEESGLSKGVGPIKELKLEALDETLAAQGEKLFSGTCAACHKMDKRYVGPPLAGVTVRRSPEWIMNMIMNPTEMTQKDDTAKALLGEYMVQMSVNASESDARALLEYFRKQDQQTK